MDAPDLIGQLARLAADVGPALQPPGYDDLLQEIVDGLRALLGAAACSIAVLDQDAEELAFVAASGEGATAIRGKRLPGSSGIAGWVMASGQSIVVGDVAEDPRFAADVAAETGYVPRSMFAAPLASEQQSLGVIEVLDPTESPDDPAQEALVGAFVRQATLAVLGSELFERLGRSLLESAALAATDEDLGVALRAAAQEARGPSKEMDDLLAVFHELGRLGGDARQAAVRLLTAFLLYARDQDRPA